MAFHRAIHRLLIFGAHQVEPSPELPTIPPPAVLEPLLAVITPVQRHFDATAVQYGDRYRSGFWAIYLLSALATLCAVLPLALGWDSALHRLHPYAGFWACGEVLLIGTVSLIYWRGQRRNWHAEWLRARTVAELCAYLPVIAPLVRSEGRVGNWYQCLIDAEAPLARTREVSELCTRLEPSLPALGAVWSDPVCLRDYARWVSGQLERQYQYHRTLAQRQRALLHRVHRINGILFGLTGLAALAHLWVHSLWLSLVTTFFPALGASLHGALAQSEAERMSASSENLMSHLRATLAHMGGLAERAAAGDAQAVAGLKEEVRAAIERLLEEHEDWHQLVHPHPLPLA